MPCFARFRAGVWVRQETLLTKVQNVKKCKNPSVIKTLILM